MGQINLGGSIGVPGSVAVLGNYNVIFTTDADHTLTAMEWSNNFLEVTSNVSLTASRQVISPLNQGQEFVVQNSTTGGQDIIVIGATGTGVTIANGATVAVVCDGTNYLSTGGGASGNAVTIQGYPVAPTAPETGQALEWNGSDYTPLTLPILSTLTLDGYSGNVFVEVGELVYFPSFTATYNGNQVPIVPITATIQDNVGNPMQDVTSTPDAFTYDAYYQYVYYPKIPSSVTFALTSDYYGASTTATTTVTWVQNVYYGVGIPGYSTGTDIQSLSNSFLSDTKTSVFAVDAGLSDGYVIYYAYRSDYGPGDFWVNNFEGGFTLVSDMIRVTNSQGFVDYYSLYQSDQTNLGVTEVSVFSTSDDSIVFSGDLAGTNSVQEVFGILSQQLPPLSDGYLNWNGTSWQFSPLPPPDPLRPLYTGTFTTSNSSPHTFTALTAALPSSPEAANTEVSVLLTATDGTDAATFYLHKSYLNISGTITALTYANSPNNSAHTSGAGGWAASLVVSGTNITVVIQGAGTTIQWTGENQLTIGYAP